MYVQKVRNIADWYEIEAHKEEVEPVTEEITKAFVTHNASWSPGTRPNRPDRSALCLDIGLYMC
jgi:hypothetical protein